MKVTNVSIKKLENNDSRIKGYANVILDDCLAIHDIKIVDGKDKLFIAMPSRKAIINDEEKYFDYVHPIVQTFREELESAIINQYNK